MQFKVKFFGVVEGDAKGVALALQEALDEFCASPRVEFVDAQTVIAYDPEELSVHGVLTVKYRDITPGKETS